MARKMPPKNMRYVPFSHLPQGCYTYKKSYVRLDWVEEHPQHWECAYEWWFKVNGKWYMHVNQYWCWKSKGKPQAEFGKVFVTPVENLAVWKDAEGKEAPYVHSNLRRRVA